MDSCKSKLFSLFHGFLKCLSNVTQHITIDQIRNEPVSWVHKSKSISSYVWESSQFQKKNDMIAAEDDSSCQIHELSEIFLFKCITWLDSWTRRTCFEASITDSPVWIPAACSSLSVLFPDCWLISSSWFQQLNRPSTTQPSCPSLCLSCPLRFYWESKVNSVWIFTVNLSCGNKRSKSAPLRNAAGAKELISSAGSQPPGACV